MAGITAIKEHHMEITGLVQAVSSFLQNTPLNRIEELDGIKIYMDPVIKIASAHDPLFTKLKEPIAVGPFHKTPGEWFIEAESVISYFLPFSDDVRRSNRVDNNNPSIEWLYGRIEGELLNNEIRNVVAGFIKGLNGRSFIPPFDAAYKVQDRKSNWSERHVGYIAGLGTFSLSRSIITEKGCAGRIGSVITDLPFKPSVRDYTGLIDYCSMCGACIKRCPAGAIDESGKRHLQCSEFLDETMKRYSPRYGCGKCQTKVPCENRIPLRMN